MRAVCQRVSSASVTVDDRVVGSIHAGWCILLGVGANDDHGDAVELVDRIVGLRAFEGDDGKMSRSAEDIHAEILVVSQITLHADLSRGRRPSFSHAARPDVARPLIDDFVGQLRDRGLHVETGAFGAMMHVEIHNDGPVTMVLSTDGWS